MSEHSTVPLLEQFEQATKGGLAQDERVLAERLLRGSEMALEAARREASEAHRECEELSERILALEAELEAARGEPDRLRALVDEERRSRRLAEQLAYAERARREELLDELAEARAHPGGAGEETMRAEARERELELEAAVQDLERRIAELDQLVETAGTARARAESRVAELSAALASAQGRATVESDPERAPIPTSPERAPVPTPPERAPVPTPGQPVWAPAADAHPSLVAVLAELRDELLTLTEVARRETEARVAVEERVADLELELAHQLDRATRAHDAIEALRTRLLRAGEVAEEVAGEAAEEAAEEVAGEMADAVADGPVAPLVPPGPPPPPEEEPSMSVEPERLDDALSRLRESAPPPAESAEPAERVAVYEPVLPEPVGRWLGRVFRELAETDPAAAGQLVLELLPAQRLVHPDPIAYDLEMSGQTCVQLTIADGGLRLELGTGRRPPGEVRFAVVGGLEDLARLLSAGRLSRWLRVGMPKVIGDRRGLQALDGLIGSELSLSDLHRAGVRMESSLALKVVARMIDPAWTRGWRFAVTHERGPGGPQAHLLIRDGEPPVIAETAETRPSDLTIVGPSESLLPVLAADPVSGVELLGDRERLTKLQNWIKRAQT
jgi:hypothetical protein